MAARHDMVVTTANTPRAILEVLVERGTKMFSGLKAETGLIQSVGTFDNNNAVARSLRKIQLYVFEDCSGLLF